MTLKQKVDGLKNELIALRRDFHMYPELGFEEYRTSGKIFSYLKDCDLEVSKAAKTGVVGLLKGKEIGKTLLLRADMDALPIKEQTGLSYASKHDGIMHACGHDGHTAMLLVAARILSHYRNQLKGNIKFVFQPNEEDAGAELMIEEGVMDNPPVDAAAGTHLWPALRTGTVDISDGAVMAASHYFYLTIKGQGGHAGSVNRTVDPIMIGAAVIQAVQAMQTRELDPLQPVAIIFTKLDSGFNTTIVPEQAELQGSIRCLTEQVENLKDGFERVISGICNAHRAKYELNYKVGNNIVTNALQMAALAREAAAATLGDDKMVTSGLRTMGGEDFSEFSRLVPSVFYFIGTGNDLKNTAYSIHHPCYNLDEDSLPVGAELHSRLALTYFGIDHR